MRGLLLFVVAAACSFDHGALPVDARTPDSPPDVIMRTWEVDGTSQKAVPASLSEWDRLREAFALGGGPPAHLWLMQETVGGLADSIGSITLAPQGAPSYQHVIAGWSRRAVGTPDLDGDRGFQTTLTGNLDGSSYLLLLYVAVAGTPSMEKSLVGIGASTDHRYVSITPALVLKATGAGVTPTTGTASPGIAVHPVVVKIDATSQAYVVYTDVERLAVSWKAPTAQGGLLIVGNAIIGAAPARYLYGALWKGSSAELADADVKKLLQSLGWTISW